MKAKSNVKLASLIKNGTRLKYLLEECEFGSGFKHLTNEQWKELWDLFHTWLKQNESNTEDVLDFLSLALDSDNNVANVVKPMKFLLAKMEAITENQTRNAFCKLCEKWLSVEAAPAVPDMDSFVFRHLLMLSSNELSTANVKRLNRFRKNLNSELVFAHLGIINKLIQNPKFMDINAGQKFFMVAACQSIPIFNKCFSTITLELKDCSKKTAKNYGKALMLTWKEAKDETKVEIAYKFQELMEEFLKLKRLTLGLPKHSANILSLIDVWNKEVRQKADQAFSTMITKCYQPILWKYFAIGHNFQRCNAADLFFKAFPLNLIDEPEADSQLFSVQVDYMEKTLRDDCHVTRIIAIREICNILSVHWTIFSTVQINRLMKIIAKEEVCDASSAEVRRTVWRGFESLLTTDLACSYLQKFLPNLKDYLYDVSATVRIAFVKLLIAIRDLKKPDFKVSSIVPTSELMRCLQDEDSTVGQWLVKLLMPSYYSPKHAEADWIMKFAVVVKKYPHCYRNFFFFSKKCLKFEDALNIMCKLIENLGAFVMTKLRAANDENDSQSANLSSRSSSMSNKAEESSVGGSTCAFDDPKIVIGLLEILAILWVLHGDTLTKQPSASAKLINTYLGHTQHFIMYYKNTSVFPTVIHVTGNVPTNILTKNSITLHGYCMKVFKSHKAGELDEDSTLTMISALVKWGRCGELLEMITLWLEAALKSNDCDVLENRVKRVKISDAVDPDSLLAVNLLNKILERSVTRIPTLKKNYDNLVEIFNLMDNIKFLINGRLLRGTPYTEELLSDEFLMACYRRYVKLIPLLRREDDLLAEEEREHLVDAPLKLKDLIAWIQDDLIPLLHTEQPADLYIITQCINDALEMCESMLKVKYIDHEEFPKFEQVITSLLTIEHNLHFVKASASLTAAMSAHSMVYLLDKNPRVWFVIIPNIVSNIMNALVLRAHSHEEINSFKQDLQAVGTSITKILECYEYCIQHHIASKETLNCVQVMIQRILNCARVVLGRNLMRENNTIPSYSTVASLPPVAATLLGPLNNHPVWLSLFLQEIQEHISDIASVKNLMIDVLIIHLFKKCDQKATRLFAMKTVREALNRLEYFKNHQRTVIRPSVSVGLLGREPVNDTEELGTLPTSAAALSRDSEPCSNVVTVGTEPRESETGCIMMECEESAGQPTNNEVPLSQTAVSGSQPNEPRTSHFTECRASTMSHFPEEELYADTFIQRAEELLTITMEFFNKPVQEAKSAENEQD